MAAITKEVAKAEETSRAVETVEALEVEVTEVAKEVVVISLQVQKFSMGQ